jgi:transglutaminase-like putative cysteine protease
MTTDVALWHRTRYRFARPVTLGPHLIRLRPAPHTRTRIRAYSLDVDPAAHRLHWQQDPFGNWQARVFFLEPTDHLEVTVDLVAEMAVVDPFDFYVEPEASQWPFAYDADLAEDLRPYLETEPIGPEFQALLESIPRDPAYTVTFLVELNQRLAERIGYLVRLEPGVQTLEETLRLGSGSCRDTGWLLVQLCRRLGIAARFVSGYLIQLAGDPEGTDGPAEDIPDLHAWSEVFLPGAGWIGLDPTSGLLAGEGHIPLAVSPRPDHAAPVTGTAELPALDFGHEMAVQRLAQRPRPLRPFLPDQWLAIETLGRAVDDRVGTAGLELRVGRCHGDQPLATRWTDAAAAVDGSSADPEGPAYRLDGMPETTAPSPVVVGAPFAARPDLLGALVAYWQLHPALSFFFSGGRVGPEGPAPRLDELGPDRLSELALALGGGGGGLADLLTDAAGDPDGAELAFDAPRERLALRSFGAAPQPRMALLEELLVRALVLRCWQTPCPTSGPVAHGPALADRFMLPYWLWRDLEAVLAELRAFGLAFEPSWFEAQHGFRFPRYGSVEVAGVRLELRAALEPVRLLPVAVADGERRRLVDDSLDRLEVRVTGELNDRLVPTCNGWALPLAPTPDGGRVAGVRFRARALPRLWQPGVAVTTPLCFDLVDTALGRSLGGCRYHVGKADGGEYDAAPANDLAAEPRRLARFEAMGHTAGEMQPRRSSSMCPMPHTLDLRHAAG